MDRQQLAFELEEIMQPYDDYEALTDAPEKFILLLHRNRKENCPTGWGIHEKYGYFILSSTGQGPCIDYLQNEQL